MPAKIDLNTIVSRDPTPVTADMDGDVVMMSIEQGNYYGLGKVGSRIWQELTPPLPVSDLCDKLMDAYAVDRPTCETDTIRFLQQLLDEGLIRLDDENAPE